MAGEREAFKLIRVRANGTLGPLFINKTQVLPLGVWMDAENHPTPGFAVRPGWHAAPQPYAPHLGTKGRRWFRVLLAGVEEHTRPECQGGKWLLARRMKILGPAEPLQTKPQTNQIELL
jgi:hypothetical protein